MMAEHEALRPDEVDLPGDELREAALDGRPVAVPSAGRGENGRVGTQVPQHAGPVAGRVLIQQAAVRRLEEVDERPPSPRAP